MPARPQVLALEVLGLRTNPNPFSRAPLGAMAVASNLVIDSPGVGTSRRGQAPFGSALSGGTISIDALTTYASRVVGHHDDTLFYDSDGAGTWLDYSGTFTAPASARLHFAPAGGNLYATSSTGVVTLDALAGSWQAAGVVRALDGDASLTAGTIVPDNAAVAYRLVWGRTDANGREHLGTPSPRIVIANSSGGTRNVSLTVIVPSAITTSYFWRLYRSGPSATAADEPNDELQLVRQGTPSSGEISARSLTIADSTPDALLGETIYTAPSQEGIDEANEQPPVARDLCAFREMMFYGGIAAQRQRLALTLLGVGPAANIGFSTQTGTTTSGLATVTGLSDTSLLNVGMKAKAAAGIPSTARILTIDSGTQVTLTVNATASGARSIEFQDVVTLAGREYYAASAESATNHEFLASTSGTAAENVQSAALSLAFVVNKDSGNSAIYAYYESGFDDLPGQLSLEARALGASSFAATSTAGESFSPQLPTSGTTVSSDPDAQLGSVMVSKVGQAEAVPLTHIFPVGDASAAVQRVFAMRDSVIVVKEDGAFRLDGDAPETLTVSALDPTLRVVSPETIARLDNALYALTAQGPVVLSETVGSRAIGEGDVTRDLLALSALASFATVAWAVAYESDRKWLLAVPTSAAATTPSTVYVLDVASETWTTWDLDRTAGVVDASQRLVLADSANSRITRERKARDRTDFADDQLAVTVVSATGTTVQLASTAGLSADWLLVQGLVESAIVSVTDGTHVVVADTRTWSAGAATAYEPITVEVQWLPIAAGSPTLMKQFSELAFPFEGADFAEIELRCTTDLLPTADTVVDLETVDTLGAWGASAWGSVPWGQPSRGQQVLRTLVPLEAQRAHWLNIALRLRTARESFSILGATVSVQGASERYRGTSRAETSTS